MFRELTDHELYVLEDKLWESRVRIERAVGFIQARGAGIWRDVDEVWCDVEAERCRRERERKRV